MGPGGGAVYDGYSRRVEQDLKNGATYIGIDIRFDNLDRIAHLPQAFAVNGDFGKIPLRDSVADEIWVANVFGGDLLNVPERLPNGTFVYTPGLDKYFKEMARILKPGGSIYIAEWIPRIHDPEWLMDEDFQAYGLSKKVYKEANLKEFVFVHGWIFGITWKDTPPFFLALTKEISPS